MAGRSVFVRKNVRPLWLTGSLLAFSWMVFPGSARATTEADVRAACEKIWIHGITAEIAEQEIGAGGVAYLQALIADPEFGSRDTAVAFLGFLGGDEAVAGLRRLLEAPPASLEVPEEDRALLLTPISFGNLAARGSGAAKRALWEMTESHGNGGPLLGAAARRSANPASMRDDLVEMAIQGLARSGDPEAIERVREIRRGTRVIGDGPRDLQRTARQALRAQRASQGARPAGSSKRRSSASRATASAPATGTTSAGSVIPRNVNRSVSRSHGLADGHPDVIEHHLSYSNHVDLGSLAITESRVDSILERADLMVGREDFDGDVACCGTFRNVAPPNTFGSAGDSLDIIDSPGELAAVLNNGNARFKVVRLINYCGGVAAAGCAWRPGWGAAVVRYSDRSFEAILAVHEYGHNIGLAHTFYDSRMFMYGGGGSFHDGVDSTHCDRLHSPAPEAAINADYPAVCGDTDGDLVHDYVDNCPLVSNLGQQDSDGNGVGSVCDCGDGLVSGGGGEGCDDGNAVDGDGCDSNCTLTACGNGIVTAGEQCDDANTESGDGCLPGCVAEYCGDGVLNNNGETCEDGNNISGDGCSSTCHDEVRLCGGDGCTMFATSTRTSGEAGGFSGADAFCNERAAAAGLPGHFKAWLGSADNSGTSAAGRLDPDSGPFLRTCGGGTIATSIADLLDGSLALPVGCDEFGISLAGDCTGTWTGTQSDGTPNSGCVEWSTTSAQGSHGDECASGPTWTQGAGNPLRACSDQRRLYCIEQYQAPECGNGILQLGEACDDGNLVNGDGCNDSCSDCGDGVVGLGEACDDGNGTEGDGCDSNCTVSACGNGVVGVDETCDDGNALSDDGCSDACAIEFCGDGVLNNNGETCEDGNTVSGDGCSETCRDELRLCGGNGCTMFATSTQQQGNVGGFAGADAVCEARAAAAGLPGHYKAWLGSTSSGTTAASRLDAESGPFVRTCGGGTIATNIADLLDGSLALPVGCDEFGNALPCTGSWSGTDSNGSASDGCGDWTNNAFSARTADECSTSSTWTQSDTRSCTEARRFYCIEQYRDAVHGDGILQLGEQCDDGNVLAGDCCAPDGTAEAAGASCASDGNPCTDDVCDGAGHCGASNSASCDDGLYCNGSDSCLAGSCQLHDGSPCAAAGECGGGCDEGLDTCTNLPAGSPCSDFGNDCIDPVCDGAGNCGVNNAAPCDDGSFCNGADTCAGGACTQHAGDPCAAGPACADTCDEIADSCLVASGTTCASDGNVCTDDECDGSGNCVHTANTAACDDGSLCTTGDTCAGGSCAPGASTLDCDDDDACTRDSCDQTSGCRNVAAPIPVQSCLVAPKTQLQVKASTPEKNRIKWKWGSGEAFGQAMLGAPDVDTTYKFCLFDMSESVPSLEAGIEVPAGAGWTSKEPKGWSYSRKDGLPDGATKMSLGTGVDGKTKAKFQAGGASLAMPAPFAADQYFAKDPQVVAQLVGSNGLCLTSVFPTASTNDGASFKAKTTVAPTSTGPFTEAGPFAVGVRSEVFVDATRTTMANGAYPGAPTRTLATQVWYPAQTAGTETPSATGGPFPIVLIAHGFTSQGIEHTLLGEHLASHGFIVAAPNFPLAWLGAPGGSTSNDLVSQAGDVTFVLESLVALGADSLDVLFGKVDGSSRAVVGHSLGGMTAAIAGYDAALGDADLDAVVAMGHPSCHQLASYYADGPPFLIIGGTGDAAVPFTQHAALTYDRAPAPKRLVTLQGGTHVGFVDASIGQAAGVLDEQFCNAVSPVLRPAPMPEFAGFPASDPAIDYAGCTMCNPLGTGLMEADRQHELTQAAVLAFLKSELEGDADAATFLDSALASENADISVVATP